MLGTFTLSVKLVILIDHHRDGYRSNYVSLCSLHKKLVLLTGVSAKGFALYILLYKDCALVLLYSFHCAGEAVVGRTYV